MKQGDKMNVIFFGTGSIGRRQIEIVKNTRDDVRIFAYHHDSTNYIPIIGVNDIFSWNDIKVASPEIAFICNPTNLHIDTAIKCAELGINLFIEKPIDVSCERLGELIKIIKQKNLFSYVAYPFRHHPLILELESFRNCIKDYHFKSCRFICRTNITRWGKEYSKSRDTGGGALLELSHEIDLAEFIFGTIGSMSFVGGIDVLNNMEHQCTIRAIHSTGVVSYIHFDLYSRTEERYLSFCSVENNFRIDYKANDEMYKNQIDSFFYDYYLNIDQCTVSNSLVNAAGLFKKIIDLRNTI